MSIDSRILGTPGRDNAMLATVDTGQSQHRLLFDCGEGCLSNIPVAQIQSIEAVFFSHFHIDHVAGFDTFLRMNWSRPESPVRIFGPPGTIEILHHRLRGYTWNLVSGAPGEWVVTEVGAGSIRSSRFLTREGFEREHDLGESRQLRDLVYRSDRFEVRSHTLDHGTPCLAFRIDEFEHSNVDAGMLQELGLEPGPWLKVVKDPGVAGDGSVRIAGVDHRVDELRSRLLTLTPGDSIAYLTDFCLPTETDEDQLVRFLSGCETLVCENNYRNADADLAKKNYHMTCSDIARLASRVSPETLVLFHLSDRYAPSEWWEQLEEVRAGFDRAVFPDGWEIAGPVSSGGDP